MASHWAQKNLQPLRALDPELRCIPVVLVPGFGSP